MVLEGRGSLEVIGALIIKTPGSSLTPLPCEDTASMTQTENIYFLLTTPWVWDYESASGARLPGTCFSCCGNLKLYKREGKVAGKLLAITFH